MTQQRAGSASQGYAQTSKEGRLRDVADAAGERIKEAADSAQEKAGSIADQAQHYGEQAQEAIKQFRPYIQKSLKERPMSTLAVAAAIGLVLGALWKK